MKTSTSHVIGCAPITAYGIVRPCFRPPAIEAGQGAKDKPLHMLRCTEVPQQTVVQGHSRRFERSGAMSVIDPPDGRGRPTPGISSVCRLTAKYDTDPVADMLASPAFEHW
jgi:hypothetical protein